MPPSNKENEDGLGTTQPRGCEGAAEIYKSTDDLVAATGTAPLETTRQLERMCEVFFNGLDEYAKTADPEVLESITKWQGMKEAAK